VRRAVALARDPTAYAFTTAAEVDNGGYNSPHSALWLGLYPMNVYVVIAALAKAL
jgi:hypothetical protein